MNAEEKTQKPLVEDVELVDLVAAALVDPNLHTDMRMRIANEITELLRAAHNDLYGPDGREAHERTAVEHDHQVPKMLEAVLVDPNLHTDLRMRLHREIQELLRRAHEHAGASAEQPD
jgi:hypothetical protein